MFCREWLAQLELHKDAIHAADLQIIAVGIGKPKHAVRVCGRFAPSLACLTNEQTDTHRAYGLEQATLGQVLSPAVAGAAIRATLRFKMQGATTGDPMQLPGTFIVDTLGRIRYTYYSQHVGDHPNIQTLIDQMPLAEIDN